jgi:hypothetical protein
MVKQPLDKSQFCGNLVLKVEKIPCDQVKFLLELKIFFHLMGLLGFLRIIIEMGVKNCSSIK